MIKEKQIEDIEICIKEDGKNEGKFFLRKS